MATMHKVRLAGRAIDALENLDEGETPAGTVAQIRGEERLFGAFRYTVRYDYAPDSPPDFSDVVNKGITLHFQQVMNDDTGAQHGGDRRLYGIVTKVRQHGSGVKTGSGDLNTTSYLLDIRPALWRLQLSRRHRTFSNRPLVSKEGQEGVLNQVIQVDHGLRMDVSTLKRTYPEQKTIRQRDETDLEFVNRLAQKHGLVYYVPGSATVHTAQESKSVDHSGEVKLVDEDGAYETYWRCSRRTGAPTQSLRATSSVKKRKKEGVLDEYSYEHNLTPSRSAAIGVDFEKGEVRREWTEEQEEQSDTEGIVWESGQIMNYPEHSPTSAWGRLENQRSPNLAETKGNQVQAGKRVLRGHTHSRLLGAGMRFSLDEATCEDVLTHFEEAEEGGEAQAFVVRRLLVSTNQTQTGESTASTTLNMEFEAFPASPSSTYQGDRYVERGTNEGGPAGQRTHTRSRFNDLAEKYSALQDSVKALVTAVMEGKKSLSKKQIQNLKDTPVGAKGLEALDPYEMTLEGTARPAAPFPLPFPPSPPPSPKPDAPELHTATVEKVPGGSQTNGGESDPGERAKQGQVKVTLDLDDGRSDTVWARVLSFWAGNDWGAQFMPREGAHVLVANPSHGDDQFFVVGSLFGGTETMPHAEAPAKSSGIRGQSSRANVKEGEAETVHNEILLKDEANEEEIRILAPTYRTDVTGFGRDVEDEKREYHDLSGKSDRTINEFTPPARERVTKQEYKEMPSAGNGDKVAKLDPFIRELTSEYDLDGEGEGVSDKTLKKYKNLGGTKIKMKKDIEKFIKNKIDKKEISLKEFVRMPERSRLHMNDEIKSMELGNIEKFERSVSVGEWKEMQEKTVFDLGIVMVAGVDQMRELLEGNDREEIESLLGGIHEIGRDAYEGLRPYRKAYGRITPGKDAYHVVPYQEAYEKASLESVLAHGEQARAEYTEGGVLEACQGTYEIHTYGDRIEICRGKKTSGDVFDQEATKEWAIDGLPGELDRYGSNDDKPILILSKDGAIEIQSKKGINIESGGDVNIQSGGDISMYADGKISEESNVKHTVESKDVEVKGNMESGSIEVISSEISIGKYPATKEVSFGASTVDKHSDHHYETRTGIKVKKENYVASMAQIHDNAAVMHNIQAMIGTKAALVDTKTPLVDNKNFLVDNKNGLLDNKNVVLDNTNLAVKVDNEGMKSRQGGLGTAVMALLGYA